MNEQRIRLLQEFIDQEPENPFNKYALAMEYYNEAPEDSLSMLSSLLDNYPDYLPSYFKAAHLLWEDEKWKQAEQVFIKGIELAEKLDDKKTLMELKTAYQNFQFDMD